MTTMATHFDFLHIRTARGGTSFVRMEVFCTVCINRCKISPGLKVLICDVKLAYAVSNQSDLPFLISSQGLVLVVYHELNQGSHLN